MTRKGKCYQILFYIMALLLILSIGMNALVSTYLVKYEQRQGEEIEQENHIFSEEVIEAECEAYYKKQLKKLLEPEEIRFLAQKQWECILSVNGQEVTQSTLSMSGPRNIRVMIAEVVLSQDVLPLEMLRQGRLEQAQKGEVLTDYISVQSTIPYEIIREELGENVRYYYEFEEVPAGTMIIFQMGTILKEQLRNKDAVSDGRLDIIIK